MSREETKREGEMKRRGSRLGGVSYQNCKRDG